jgi:hypothetical protein
MGCPPSYRLSHLDFLWPRAVTSLLGDTAIGDDDPGDLEWIDSYSPKVSTELPPGFPD